MVRLGVHEDASPFDRSLAPTTSPGSFSRGGLRSEGVKLRDLGTTVRTYPPLEKGPKGLYGQSDQRGDKVTVP